MNAPDFRHWMPLAKMPFYLLVLLVQEELESCHTPSAAMGTSAGLSDISKPGRVSHRASTAKRLARKSRPPLKKAFLEEALPSVSLMCS